MAELSSIAASVGQTEQGLQLVAISSQNSTSTELGRPGLDRLIALAILGQRPLTADSQPTATGSDPWSPLPDLLGGQDLQVERPGIGLRFRFHSAPPLTDLASADPSPITGSGEVPPEHFILASLTPHADPAHAQQLPLLSNSLVVQGQIASHDSVDLYRLRIDNQIKLLDLQMLPHPGNVFTGNFVVYDSTGRLIGRANGQRNVTLAVEATAPASAVPYGSSIYVGVEPSAAQNGPVQTYQMAITRVPTSNLDIVGYPLGLPRSTSGPTNSDPRNATSQTILALPDVRDSATSPPPIDPSSTSSSGSEPQFLAGSPITTPLPTRTAPAFAGVLAQGLPPRSNPQDILDAVDLVLGGDLVATDLHDSRLAHELGGVPLRSVASQAIQLNFLMPPVKASTSDFSPVESVNVAIPKGPRTLAESQPRRSLGLDIGLQVGIGLLAAVALPEISYAARGPKRKSFKSRLWKLAGKSA